METGPIIRRAWDISWQHKSLWIFGLFAESLGAARLVGRLAPGDDSTVFSKFFSSPAAIPIFILLGFVGLVLFVMTIISGAALVDAANRLARGGVYTWRSSFSAGIDFFWRYLGLALLMLGAVIGLGLALFLPGLFFFLLSTILGVVSLLVLIPAALVGIFILANIYALAMRAMIVRNISIGDAIEEGYWLVKLHWRDCLKIFLVYILLIIAIGILTLAVVALIAAPFVVMALGSTTGIVVAILLGLPLVAAVMLVVNGLFGTFYSSIYTLFYFELLEPTRAIEPGIAGQPVL